MQAVSSPDVITRRAIRIPLEKLELCGELAIGENPRGLIVFLNGDGDHLYDRMNNDIARRLFDVGFATLNVDLLTPNEAVEDAETSALRFHQTLLASRIVKVTRWARGAPMFDGLRIGFFASGLCAGAVLAAASVSSHISAVVVCGPRADLVLSRLNRIRADVLVLAGQRDTAHLSAISGMCYQLPRSAHVETLPNAAHLMDEPGVRDRVAIAANWWFDRSLGSSKATGRRNADILVETA